MITGTSVVHLSHVFCRLNDDFCHRSDELFLILTLEEPDSEFEKREVCNIVDNDLGDSNYKK